MNMEKQGKICISMLLLWIAAFCRHSIHAFTLKSISLKLSAPSSTTCIHRQKNISPLHFSFSEEVAANDEVMDINGEEDGNDASTPDTLKNEIAVDATIDLPFGAGIAFDAFSDLPRQPSWSSWLRSVSYIEDDGSSSRDKNDDIIIQREEKEKRNTYFINDSSCIDVERLRQTKWVMGWKKIRFSWKSKVTFMERPKCIKWESTSGLKNMGLIEFKEQTLDGADTVTQMTLKMKFIAPRIVAKALKRSDKIDAFMKSKILQPTLIKFRDVVLVNDLGMEAMSAETLEV